MNPGTALQHFTVSFVDLIHTMMDTILCALDFNTRNVSTPRPGGIRHCAITACLNDLELICMGSNSNTDKRGHSNESLSAPSCIALLLNT